ncbi:histidine phosphatase family protein [Pseudomonas wadenswilerensis]
MKSTQLTFICHARTDAQRVGRFHLMEDGLADSIEPQVVPEKGTRVLIAPELRTRQTAEGLGLVGQLDSALRDCDFGRWQGLSLKRLEQEDPIGLQQWLSDPGAAPHGGESVTQVCARVGRWLDETVQPGEWLVVTHPIVIRAALSHVLECPLTALQHIDVLPLAQVRLSRFGRWRLRIE